MAMNPGLENLIRGVIADALSDPTNLPSEFLSFLPQHVAQNPVPSTGSVVAPILASTGLKGATSPSRYVGATSSGAPASGAFQIGDFVVDHSGVLWICTVAGSPGTWNVATAPVSSVFGRTGAITANSGDYTAAKVTNAADRASGSSQLFTGGIGYATGGAVSSSGPTATVNNLRGQVTFSTSVAGGTSGTFQINNSLVSSSDLALVGMKSATTGGLSSLGCTIDVTQINAGSFVVFVANNDTVTLSTFTFNFAILKAS